MDMLTCAATGCNDHPTHRGFCQTHYSRLKNTGMTELRTPIQKLEARLWARVDRGGPDDCWPWTGGSVLHGYGRITARWALGGPQVWGAHRVSYVLAYGPLPPDRQIDHVSAHLEAVTQLENMVRREIRIDRTLFGCGHPRSGNRVKNGGPTGRCAECHRTKEAAARAEGRRAGRVA